MAQIHPTAIVDPKAELHETTVIGPYAVIGPNVRLGAGTSVGPHSVLDGDTTIGANNRIFQFASIGAPPQDLKYRGQPTKLVIGDGNQIREFTTVHLGTEEGGGITRVGNRCLLMAYSHVAHDVQVGNGVILANSAQLAGHVIVEDFVIFGGVTGVHQFVRIGKHAFISGGSMIGMDIPPFCTATGHRASLAGINSVGLQRHKYSETTIREIKKAYRILFRMKLGLREAITRVRAEIPAEPEVEHMLAFIEASERGVAR